MNKPLVDTNTLWAINTLFLKRHIDPWAQNLLGHFTNLFVYSDFFRFTVPTPDKDNCDPTQGIPIIQLIQSRDTNLIVPTFLVAPEPKKVSEENLVICLERFSDWAHLNPTRLKSWLLSHLVDDELWANWTGHLKRNYVFDIEDIISSNEIISLSKRVNVPERHLVYALDNILRMPEYGQLVGADQYYLNHPLRDAFQLPVSSLESAAPPNVPISWHKAAVTLSDKTDLDGFIVFLLDLRNQVHEYKLHKVSRSDQVEKDVVRDIAQRVGLPPQFKYHGLTASILTGILTSLAVFPALGPLSAVAGGAVTVTTNLWKGNLPSGVGKIKWLKWAIKWDVEDQIDTC